MSNLTQVFFSVGVATVNRRASSLMGADHASSYNCWRVKHCDISDNIEINQAVLFSAPRSYAVILAKACKSHRSEKIIIYLQRRTKRAPCFLMSYC